MSGLLFSVHLEMVDFGSRQGRSTFVTEVVVRLRRGLQKCENAVLGQKMPFLNGHYLMQTRLTCNRSLCPANIFSIPSCLRVVISSSMAWFLIFSIFAFS